MIIIDSIKAAAQLSARSKPSKKIVTPTTRIVTAHRTIVSGCSVTYRRLLGGNIKITVTDTAKGVTTYRYVKYPTGYINLIGVHASGMFNPLLNEMILILDKM